MSSDRPHYSLPALAMMGEVGKILRYENSLVVRPSEFPSCGSLTLRDVVKNSLVSSGVLTYGSSEDMTWHMTDELRENLGAGIPIVGVGSALATLVREVKEQFEDRIDDPERNYLDSLIDAYESRLYRFTPLTEPIDVLEVHDRSWYGAVSRLLSIANRKFIGDVVTMSEEEFLAIPPSNANRGTLAKLNTMLNARALSLGMEVKGYSPPTWL